MLSHQTATSSKHAEAKTVSLQVEEKKDFVPVVGGEVFCERGICL